MPAALHLLKATAAAIVERAGILQLKLYHMESIKQNSLGNKAISPKQSTDRGGRAPSIWFFQDHQWKQRHNPNFKPQATSVKHQAPIFRKQQATKLQAASDKLQAPSCKHQAPSRKLQAS